MVRNVRNKDSFRLEGSCNTSDQNYQKVNQDDRTVFHLLISFGIQVELRVNPLFRSIISLP
jgi:hypothetical protein